MLPELIYREERKEDYKFLFVLGALSGLIGFAAAKTLFPSELDILSVVFASMPLIYPLNKFFFEEEEDNAPLLPEILVYSSLFVGEMFAFLLLGLVFPEAFSAQSTIVGATGFATQTAVSFSSIFMNNIGVFAVIFFAAAFIGSSGAFILTWNASVLGYFFSVLISSMSSASGFLSCTKDAPSPLCYLPHASFEMGGFVIAGVSGTLISAAVYREHLDREEWKNYIGLVLVGLVFVFIGAVLETA